MVLINYLKQKSYFLVFGYTIELLGGSSFWEVQSLSLKPRDPPT